MPSQDSKDNVDDDTRAFTTDETAAASGEDPAAGDDQVADGSFFATDRTEESDTTEKTDAAKADDESTEALDTEAATGATAVGADDTATSDRKRVSHTEEDLNDQPTHSMAAATAAGDAEHTRPMAAVTDEDADEQRRRDTERRRAERDEALGNRRRRPAEATEQPAPVAAPKPAPARRSTDKFFGSLGLFVLRIVMAAVMALHGLTHVLNLDQTIAMIDGSWLGTMVGQPVILAYVLGIAELLVAVSLLFGFGVRIAGVAMIAIGGLALATVHWTQNPFDGFVLDGEPALMVAAIGFAFFATGGGGWAADRAVRARRQERKAAKN